MLEAAVAFKAAITDFVGHAGHKAHAAPVERGAVEIGTTVLGDSAAEELVAFAGALFAKTTHVAVRGTKEAVAVFLAALIANAFAETLLGLSIGDADFAAVRALLVRLARQEKQRQNATVKSRDTSSERDRQNSPRWHMAARRMAHPSRSQRARSASNRAFDRKISKNI